MFKLQQGVYAHHVLQWDCQVDDMAQSEAICVCMQHPDMRFPTCHCLLMPIAHLWTPVAATAMQELIWVHEASLLALRAQT